MIDEHFRRCKVLGSRYKENALALMAVASFSPVRVRLQGGESREKIQRTAGKASKAKSNPRVAFTIVI